MGVNLSGADWCETFVGISKKTWLDAYLKLDKDDLVGTCFSQLGERVIPSSDLVEGERGGQMLGAVVFMSFTLS